MPRRVRWGVLGTATIAREAMLPAMMSPQYGQHCEVVGIASRQLKNARMLADALKIEKAYPSYADLLADSRIDTVYIPLPNHLHVSLSIDALTAGKHVLCEKPIGLSAAEAETLAAVSRKYPQLKLMEAFMYRLHPQWAWVQEVIASGKIGDVQTVHSVFSFYHDDPAAILHRADWGGGALMDVGCYSVSLSRLIFGTEPKRVVATHDVDPRFGVDRLTAGMMRFEQGVATFTCTTQAAEFQRVNVFGTKGRIELPTPFNPPNDRPCRAYLQVNETVNEINFDACDQYGIQVDLFSQAILHDTEVPTPIADAVANMKTLDAMAQSNIQHKWIDLSEVA